VFLHNTAPGVVERLGLDGETLRIADARLVVVNISGYGSAGPRKDRKAYDMLVQAESGMVTVTGTPETATKTGIPTADIAAGMYAAMSAISALFRRERTGQGAVVDVSMFDAAVEWMGHPLYMQLYGGRQIPRMGLTLARLRPILGRDDPDAPSPPATPPDRTTAPPSASSPPRTGRPSWVCARWCGSSPGRWRGCRPRRWASGRSRPPPRPSTGPG